MEFNRLTLDCIEKLRPYFAENQCRICDCTIGGTFIWRDYHQTQYAIGDDGVLFFKVEYPEPALTPPRGIEPTRKTYEQIIEYCQSNELPARLFSVSESLLKDILELFPNSQARTNRSNSDYLYLSSDLTSLAGRKFSGQRNHINRFMREHPDWSFRRISSDGISEVKAFYKKFAQENVKEAFAYNEGNRKAEEVLDNLDIYKQYCGALYVKGTIVGASFGEIVDDTLFVHSEMADTAYHGSYPMLVNTFAKEFVTEGVEYINREEDDGVEGLRTSKLSYHPLMLLDKYVVDLKL